MKTWSLVLALCAAPGLAAAQQGGQVQGGGGSGQSWGRVQGQMPGYMLGATPGVSGEPQGNQGAPPSMRHGHHGMHHRRHMAQMMTTMRGGGQQGAVGRGAQHTQVVKKIVDDALRAVTGADQAIAQGNRQQALTLLDEATGALGALYRHAPQHRLVRELDELQQGLSQSAYVPQPQNAQPQNAGQQSAGALSAQAQGEQGPLAAVQRGLGQAPNRGASGSGPGRPQGTGSGAGWQRGQEGSGTSGMSSGASSGQDSRFAPLFAAIERESVYLSPAVVAGVQSARQQANQGDLAGAAQQLQEARSSLVADVALLPVEDAYGRVLAARSELQQGHDGAARQLLSGIPVILEQVQISAPLVPARFDLRAAAAAAQAGNWQSAQQLVSDAIQKMKSVEQPNAQNEVGNQLRAVMSQAQQDQQQLLGGNQVSPQELWNLSVQLGQVVQPS